MRVRRGKMSVSNIRRRGVRAKCEATEHEGEMERQRTGKADRPPRLQGSHAMEEKRREKDKRDIGIYGNSYPT